MPYLAEHFRVFTMDLRGNGRSDRPRGQAAYAFDDYYADFVAVLDAAGVDKAAVIGISATAMTALRFAAEHPERVDPRDHRRRLRRRAHRRAEDRRARARRERPHA